MRTKGLCIRTLMPRRKIRVLHQPFLRGKGHSLKVSVNLHNSAWFCLDIRPPQSKQWTSLTSSGWKSCASIENSSYLPSTFITIVILALATSEIQFNMTEPKAFFLKKEILRKYKYMERAGAHGHLGGRRRCVMASKLPSHLSESHFHLPLRLAFRVLCGLRLPHRDSSRPCKSHLHHFKECYQPGQT